MTVERQDFQRLLFKTAFCLMACDGHIHDLEVKELRQMVKSTAYFKGIDLSGAVEEVLKDFNVKGKHLVNEILEDLHRLNLSTVQELLVLEVSFRLVHADEKLDENEIKFIQFLRGKLSVPDELIKDRFGPVEYLFDKDYSNEIVKQETKKAMLHSFASSEIQNLKEFDLNKFIAND
ncbi:hypothetical protein ACFL43_02320 [Thermodesulfobacteriota bacterium]